MGVSSVDPRDMLAQANAIRLSQGPDARDVGIRAGNWGEVVRGYVKCDRCSARDTVSRPIRPTRATGDFAVIMPGMSEEQVEAGSMVPAGKGPRLLELIMERAKVDVGRVAWGSVTGCAQGGGGVGRESVVACKENVRGWLRGFEAVLLVGTAKDIWRPDVTVQRLALSERMTVGLWTEEQGGRDGDRQSWIVGVVSSPGSVFGHPEPSVAIGGLVRRLIEWKEVVAEVQMGGYGKVLARMGRECVECGSAKVGYVDPDGLGWCNGHVETARRGYGKSSKVVKLGGLDRWEDVRVKFADEEKKVAANRAVVGLPFDMEAS